MSSDLSSVAGTASVLPVPVAGPPCHAVESGNGRETTTGGHETTTSSPVLVALFPHIAPDKVRQAISAGRRLVDGDPPQRLVGLADDPRFADPRQLIHDHSQGVRLHLTRSADRYRCDVVVSGKEGVAFFDDGTSVNLDNFGDTFPAVDSYLNGLSRELGFPRRFCHCSAFVSPPGSGLPMHFDSKEVIVVQVYGRKRWQVADNSGVRFPTANYSSRSRYLSQELGLYYQPEDIDDPVREPEAIDMVPGHAMLLPRGHWHGTQADRESASVSLSFAFTVPTWSAVFLERLRRTLLASEHWRAPALRLDDKGGQFLPGGLSEAMDRAINALVSGELDRTLAEEVRGSWPAGAGSQQS